MGERYDFNHYKKDTGHSTLASLGIRVGGGTLLGAGLGALIYTGIDFIGNEIVATNDTLMNFLDIEDSSSLMGNYDDNLTRFAGYGAGAGAVAGLYSFWRKDRSTIEDYDRWNLDIRIKDNDERF